MNFKPNEFADFVREDVLEALQNDFKLGGEPVKLSDSLTNNLPASTQFVERFTLAVAMSSIINYHVALRGELLKHGIDIGDLVDVSQPPQPSSSD